MSRLRWKQETLLKYGKEHYFWINEKGALLKYRHELKDSEIPLLILNQIITQYGSFDIDRAKYVEEFGKIVYIIRGEINVYVTFSSNGKIIDVK